MTQSAHTSEIHQPTLMVQVHALFLTQSVTMEEELELECVNFINCTGSNFITNWTENNCLHKNAHSFKYLTLPLIGGASIIGILVSIILLSSFLYVVACKSRIKRKFLREEFSYMQEPMFLLVCHLSVCDLIYCSVCFPMIW